MVYHRPLETGTKRRIEDAAGRKRLLHTRYLSWAKASKKFPRGLIGPAGERALYASLATPEVAGSYGLPRGTAGEASHVFGAPVPVGPLDGLAVHLGMQGGVLSGPITVLFEVKNVRHWIYPGALEIYQLLTKAALLQQAHPRERILPVLVCRRRHKWTRDLAVHLGFFVIEIHEQSVLPVVEVDPAAFAEVREELGYSTLRLQDSAPARLVQSLREAVPAFAVETSNRWAEFGWRFHQHYEELRDPNLEDREGALIRLKLASGMLRAEDEEPYIVDRADFDRDEDDF